MKKRGVQPNFFVTHPSRSRFLIFVVLLLCYGLCQVADLTLVVVWWEKWWVVAVSPSA
jgi:hypothetical protein